MPGIVSHLTPFEVRIAPRNAKRAAQVDELLEKFPWEEGDKKYLNV